MAYTIIMIFIAIICVLLTVAVLLQSGQGSGLSGGIAGNVGGGGNMMGARRTADFLSKTTSVLAALFLSLSLLANFFIDRDTITRSTIQQRGVDLPYETDFVMPSQQEPAPLPEDLPAEGQDQPVEPDSE